ncbi:MAG: TonB-dependent receptor family protein [Oligoflexus sp.]
MTSGIRVRFAFFFLLACTTLFPSFTYGQDDEAMTVWGARSLQLSEPGSTTVIDQENLERFKYTDLNRILRNIPGIQIQEEEGFGLRLNLGMRGAHPHRSRKVLIMEDGIPVGPAPYAAPAAYYVPSLSLLEGIEVSKGPSAVRYGPQTIGGAVNLRSKSIPLSGLQHRLDLASGSYQFQKIHVETSGRQGRLGWLLLASQNQTTGFKELAAASNTGFRKRDLLAKLSYQLSPHQDLLVKLSWSDEDSNETYLGLSREDFANNPLLRYPASQLDRMINGRRGYTLEHRAAFVDWSSRLVVYHHGFDRTWNKLNGFADPNFDLSTILKNPIGRYEHFYQVIKGVDNTLSNDDRLLLGKNHRVYTSQGVYWEGRASLATQELEWGVRFHEDEIERIHSEKTYLMESGSLIDDASPARAGTQNKDSASAISAHIVDTFRFQDWRFTLGIRQEIVHLQRLNTESQREEKKLEQAETIPGFAVFHQLTDHMGWLFGVHRGIALAGIADTGSGKAEESINYEFGFRHMKGKALVDMIGFWNDYRNIKGTCSFSSGCAEADLDKTYDGGKAKVYGLEWNSSYTGQWLQAYWPLSFQYTYTKAEFASNFISNLNDWGLGEVRSGAPLPYIPEHQLSLQAGISLENWQANIAWKHQSSAYDQSIAIDRERIPASDVLDAAVSYFVNPGWEIYLNGDNILNEIQIVSLRPYGARPGKPRSFMLGTKLVL